MQKPFIPPKFLTIIEMETFLSKNVYLSGSENPGQIDAQMLDYLTLRRTLPDRHQHPNSFSWYWSLALFSGPTRALWNPLGIDPVLSDAEGVDVCAGSARAKSPDPRRRLDEENTRSNGDWMCDGEAAEGGCDRSAGKSFESEALLRISRISEKRSRSPNSQVRDWQELMDKFGDADSLPRRDPAQEISFGSKKKEQSENGTTSESIRENESKAQKAVIECKVLPKNSGSQMHIMDLLVKSIDVGPRERSWKKSAFGLSDDVVNVTEKNPLILSGFSSSNNRAKKAKLEIGSTNSYSFVLESRSRDMHQNESADQGRLKRKLSRSQEMVKTSRMIGICDQTRKKDNEESAYGQGSL